MKGRILKWMGVSFIAIIAVSASAFYLFSGNNNFIPSLDPMKITNEKSQKKKLKLSQKQLVTKDIKELGLQNYSALVVKDSKEWLTITKGNQSYSSYLINSVQKLMTAGMIAKEAQQGKLSLSDKISKWYPNLTKSNKVTVRNLLTMTSGLACFNINMEKKPYVNDSTELKRYIANTYLIDTKFNRWNYNSLNYIYLTGILEKVENKSYEQIFYNTYIQPLHLKHTDFYWNRPSFKNRQLRLKTGFVFSKDSNLYMPINPNQTVLSTRHMMGAGSVVMSNKDLAKTVKYIISPKSNFLNDRSRIDLYKAKKEGTYNGGFYNYKNYKSANGTANGYDTFLRVSNDGKNILIVQSNTVKKGTFKRNKEKINKIWNIMLSNQ